MAQAEITTIMGAVTNTVPNAFYMICRICSRPNLIDAFRAEIGRIATRETLDGVDVVTLNIAMLQTHCPLLVAYFNEILRLNQDWSLRPHNSQRCHAKRPISSQKRLFSSNPYWSFAI
jgi:hypothetical protein